MPFQEEFPIFRKRRALGQPLIYLDSAATAQKPQAVLDAVTEYLTSSYANPHRGSCRLAAQATSQYEAVRARVARFLGAPSERNIIFVKNATEGLNLIAQSYAMKAVGSGDEIVLSIAEHHANLLPWQRVAQKTGARLIYLYLDETGAISKSEWEKINEKTKLVALTHVSNVTGRITDVQEAARSCP
ncbi:Cysteine desulfurase, SufS subfamily [Clostridiaceae bacterium JG1575]|nr:Cysteine desulfurase, SufS subfamily [Clostridiaceae bacterium JG1575]